jgi:glycosyltransferase involved in cell wall biosynthesis
MVGLSVVMPSLNSGRYIGEAIQSVLVQDYSELELLVQDGGSNDATRDVVLSFDDSRISWVSEPDKGQADALNRAISRSSGEWILWLNADDVLASRAVAKFVPRLSSCKYGLLHGDFGLIDEQGRIVKRYDCAPMTFDRLLARGAYVFSGAVLVRRNLLGTIGAFDSRLHFCMDYDWLLRLALTCPVHYEPGIVAFLRDHPESKSRTQPWGFWREHWTVRRRHGASLTLAGRGQLGMGAMFLIRPLLRSRFWRQLRPAKRLGGPSVNTPGIAADRRVRKWLG